MKKLESLKKTLENLDTGRIKVVVEQAAQVGIQELVRMRQEVHEKILSNPQFNTQKEKWLGEAKKLRERAEETLVQVKDTVRSTLEAERTRRGRRR
jgi:hypothetical protein